MKDQITHLPDNADRSVAKQKFKITNWPTYNLCIFNVQILISAVRLPERNLRVFQVFLFSMHLPSLQTQVPTRGT
ncbi:hypothetical protein FMK80_20925 [Klebsiella oxytoca]|nr:hypothetical protein [Klebsiella pneumoniae]MBZ7323564.1 hypothetical protein [Klebsiella oxytoca]RTD06756.1 hypothetical protein EJ882_08560 [Klebsiella pneumoniae subsp. pneumoniae]RTD83377.1 hypothetical protein EJ893_01930 [Klebsiella pneumoniae subsp. pneumoniae]